MQRQVHWSTGALVLGSAVGQLRDLVLAVECWGARQGLAQPCILLCQADQDLSAVTGSPRIPWTARWVAHGTACLGAKEPWRGLRYLRASEGCALLVGGRNGEGFPRRLLVWRGPPLSGPARGHRHVYVGVPCGYHWLWFGVECGLA